MPKKEKERFINRVKEGIRERAEDAYDYGKDKVMAAKDMTEEKIKEHPFESVLIAAGVGALIGAGVALWVSSMTKRRY